jgi:hypothetical protein
MALGCGRIFGQALLLRHEKQDYLMGSAKGSTSFLSTKCQCFLERSKDHTVRSTLSRSCRTLCARSSFLFTLKKYRRRHLQLKRMGPPLHPLNTYVLLEVMLHRQCALGSALCLKVRLPVLLQKDYPIADFRAKTTLANTREL